MFIAHHPEWWTFYFYYWHWEWNYITICSFNELHLIKLRLQSRKCHHLCWPFTKTKSDRANCCGCMHSSSVCAAPTWSLLPVVIRLHEQQQSTRLKSFTNWISSKPHSARNGKSFHFIFVLYACFSLLFLQFFSSSLIHFSSFTHIHSIVTEPFSCVNQPWVNINLLVVPRAASFR